MGNAPVDPGHQPDLLLGCQFAEARRVSLRDDETVAWGPGVFVTHGDEQSVLAKDSVLVHRSEAWNRRVAVGFL